MKHLTGIIILALAVFTFQLRAVAAEPLKIGVLDLQRCMQESNEGKRLVESLKKKQTEMQNKLNKKQQELADMEKNMEKQSLMLSAEAKDERQKDFDKQRRDLGYLIQDMNDEIKKDRAEAQNDLIKIVIGVVDTIAKDKKYDLITEKSATLFYAKGLDITDEVIKGVNKVKP